MLQKNQIITIITMGNLRKRGYWEDPDVDGRILKWMFRKLEGVGGLDGVGSG
jgi:hypothetical protein